MKLGLFSDVHSNLEALKAVLTVLEGAGVNRYVCCGDIVGYGPDPNKCVELVRGLKPLCVAGNHDHGVTNRTATNGFNAAAKRALEWTGEQLTRTNRMYLENLPLTERLDQLFVVHASPSEPDEWAYVLGPREAEEEMEFYSEAICLSGHSHHPFAAERMPVEQARFLKEESFKLKPEAKYFINLGSVGQPRDGDPRACCVVYNLKTGTMTFYRVAYDIAAVQKKILAAGLPEYLAERLEIGR
jgi:diadenosine tetraphosphatase ApaH/serine/threonine PP2A family protein phosphatase